MMDGKCEDVALLDTEHLGKFTLGDEKLEREILDMFIEQAALHMSRLRTPESTKDWFEAAHSLKGCARGIGAFRVGERAAQLEKIAEPLQDSVRCAILTLLQADLEQTKTAIQRHLGRQTAAVFV